ncbi:MAG: FAD-binding oxidoreductase [Patescibacteria group bacterium]|mgnify:FL=1
MNKIENMIRNSLSNEPHTISVWEESYYGHRDVIIVGGGLSGLWTAWNLKNEYPHLNILIIERGNIPTGASTRNAGFACFGSPSEIISDMSTMGDEVWSLIEMRYKGIQKMRKVLGDGLIGYSPCGGYECFDDSLKVNPVLCMLGDINRKMREITGTDQTFTIVDKSDNLGLSGFDKLIKNKFEGSLHSGRLVSALTQRVLSLGVTIINNTELVTFEENNNWVVVHTNRGDFKSFRLILCTNAFTRYITDSVTITPARGQILLTGPIENLKLDGTFHYNEGFIYFRNLGNRVMLGGARDEDFETEKTTQFGTTEKVQRVLEKFLSCHILKGGKYTIEKRWSGIMGFTENKKPALHISPSGNVFTIADCNGMGVAMTPIYTENVAKEMFS